MFYFLNWYCIAIYLHCYARSVSAVLTCYLLTHLSFKLSLTAACFKLTSILTDTGLYCIDCLCFQMVLKLYLSTLLLWGINLKVWGWGIISSRGSSLKVTGSNAREMLACQNSLILRLNVVKASTRLTIQKDCKTAKDSKGYCHWRQKIDFDLVPTLCGK